MQRAPRISSPIRVAASEMAGVKTAATSSNARRASSETSGAVLEPLIVASVADARKPCQSSGYEESRLPAAIRDTGMIFLAPRDDTAWGCPSWQLLQLQFRPRNIGLKQWHQRLLDRADPLLDRGTAQLHLAAILGDDLRHLRPLREARPEHRVAVLVPRFDERREIGVFLLQLRHLIGAGAPGDTALLDVLLGLGLGGHPLNEEPGRGLLLLRTLGIDRQRETSQRRLASSRSFRLDADTEIRRHGGSLRIGECLVERAPLVDDR